MKKIGLTGNIGSGKSTVADLFKCLGVPVYKADEAGHKLLMQREVAKQVLKEFGTDVFTDSIIDRKKLAAIVFNSADALRKLNAIVHPQVINNFEIFSKKYQKSKYVIFESALIFEAQLTALFDEIVLVYAPYELKIERVMQRDSCSRDSVIKRLAKQMDDNLKADKVKHKIINDGMQLIIPQVLKLHLALS